MAAQILLTQQQVAAIQFAVLGNNSFTTGTAFDSVAYSFRAGTLSQEQYIGSLIASSVGQTLYSGKSDLDVLKIVYLAVNGAVTSDAALQTLLNSGGLNSAISNTITTLLNYNGFDSNILTAQKNFDASIDMLMYRDSGTSTGNLMNSALSTKEKLAAVYLSLADRTPDMGGLAGWNKTITIQGKTFDSVLAQMISSSEFQSKGANLTGNDFINYVYKGVYGVLPTSGVLAAYSALGTNKVTITNAIINDLRNSNATDNTTVTNQHAFEYEIGTGLVYKTGAILTATAGGGNATGTVNTNASHQISNAETAVLTNVQLNANAATTVNLKFADHLADLSIGGSSAATVNLSDNGVNPGVNVTVNNGSITLNASSGADKVLLTTDAVVASATGKFNLGTGNDSLKWLGNGVSNGANTVSANIMANGGDGIDTISANLITKNVVMSGNVVTRTDLPPRLDTTLS